MTEIICLTICGSVLLLFFIVLIIIKTLKNKTVIKEISLPDRQFRFHVKLEIAAFLFCLAISSGLIITILGLFEVGSKLPVVRILVLMIFLSFWNYSFAVWTTSLFKTKGIDLRKYSLFELEQRLILIQGAIEEYKKTNKEIKK